MTAVEESVIAFIRNNPCMTWLDVANNMTGHSRRLIGRTVRDLCAAGHLIAPPPEHHVRIATLGEFRAVRLAREWEECKQRLLVELHGSTADAMFLGLPSTLSALLALTHKLDGARHALKETP